MDDSSIIKNKCIKNCWIEYLVSCLSSFIRRATSLGTPKLQNASQSSCLNTAEPVLLILSIKTQASGICCALLVSHIPLTVSKQAVQQLVKEGRDVEIAILWLGTGLLIH